MVEDEGSESMSSAEEELAIGSMKDALLDSDMASGGPFWWIEGAGCRAIGCALRAIEEK